MEKSLKINKIITFYLVLSCFFSYSQTKKDFELNLKSKEDSFSLNQGDKNLIEGSFWGNNLSLLNVRIGNNKYTQLSFSSSGVLIRKSEVVYLEDNFVLDGLSIYFSDEGNLSHIINYKKGKLDGFFAYYYENGSIEHKGSYFNGSEFGNWLYYSKSGKILRIEKYKTTK
ncbi:hypothetical protein C3B47_14120 [Flavobacterium columnare]|uniref:toxin-antitoxin system YwqK family antitoxin n=1 Tax=Flavobacterium columnare TaxID=996 RepID=UPI000D1B3F56|nr:hypothetical protein [Flavobacterium columnare]MBF6653991.1 hypothetical protein [Flavobacterium columnare]MBF6659359.1 hypothetical protein [Flavobacterium columnare]PTD14325.1 hypothetical protein C6N29_07685 [Flavobacterium columnare]